MCQHSFASDWWNIAIKDAGGNIFSSEDLETSRNPLDSLREMFSFPNKPKILSLFGREAVEFHFRRVNVLTAFSTLCALI